MRTINGQRSLGGDKPTLPKLGTAEFHCKTIVDTKGGPSINLWIFKAGYTHEEQVTNDLAFVYIPKKEFKPSGHLAAPITHRTSRTS
jgi:hypothetical protein